MSGPSSYRLSIVSTDRQLYAQTAKPLLNSSLLACVKEASFITALNDKIKEVPYDSPVSVQ